MTFGWCWPQSVRPGESVTLHVEGARPAEVTIVRDGLTPHVAWHGPGGAATITTGEDWVPGLYLVLLDDAAPTAWFVVRGAAAIVLELATNTWNAYNDVDGPNLYTGAVEVSFARPLAPGMLAKADDTPRVGRRGYGSATRHQELTTWHGMAGWAGQERRLVRWAEDNGVELGYATNQDLEQHPEVLDGCRLLLSVGHDEYWTWGIRDTVDAIVAGGGNVAFLSGNTCYWQVRIEGDVMVGYKHRYLEDPIQSHLTTTMWADESPRAAGTPRASRSATDCRRWYAKRARARPLSPCRSGSPPLRATGDQLGAEVGVVGYECDGCELTIVDGLPTGPEGFDVVATAPPRPFDEHTTPLPLAPGGRYELDFHAERLGLDPEPLRHGHAVLGCRPGRDGAGTVVTVGCTDWAYGLDDPAVDRVTRTIIERLSG